jgi:membrane-bound metal-dependent hydrolase YbcI (DUF457 family)
VIAGHFGLAAAVKARETTVPLWALMLATQWLDVVFAPLYIVGAEQLTPFKEPAGGYGNAVIHADYTHSLVGALVLASLFGAVAAWRWGQRAGIALGAVVFSHWLLDLIVHRPDMPMLPGALDHGPRLGFGLWNFPLVSVVLELAIVLVGMGLYWRSALRTVRSRGLATGRAHLAGAAAVLVGVMILAIDAAGY